MTMFNMYNMNMMNGGGWTGMLQSGLGMFTGGCGSSFSGGLNIFGGGYSNYSSFSGSNMCGGGSVFSNCFGQPNYNTMLGFTLANTLFGVAGMAFNSIRAHKQEEKQALADNQDRIADIDEEIDKLQAEFDGPDEDVKIDSKYDTNIKAASKAVETAENKSTKLAGEITDLQAKIKTAENATPVDEKNLGILKESLKKKQDEQDILTSPDENKDGSIAKLKKEEKEAKEAKTKAIEARRTEIEKEIKKLKKEQAELQGGCDEAILDKADGASWQRTNSEDFNKKYESYKLVKYGTQEEKDNATSEQLSFKKFTKADMRHVLNKYINAKTPEQKEQAREEAKTVYEWLFNHDSEDCKSFKNAMEIINR